MDLLSILFYHEGHDVYEEYTGKLIFMVFNKIWRI